METITIEQMEDGLFHLFTEEGYGLGLDFKSVEKAIFFAKNNNYEVKPMCIKCCATIDEKPQFRTNPKGQRNAGWMCEDCIKKFHDISIIPTEVKKITDIIKSG